MLYKYATGYICNKLIEKVEIERETESSVWIKGIRKAKRTHDWHNFFDTWEEAHNFLLDNSESDLKSARNRLSIAQDRNGNIKGLKKF